MTTPKRNCDPLAFAIAVWIPSLLFKTACPAAAGRADDGRTWAGVTDEDEVFARHGLVGRPRVANVGVCAATYLMGCASDRSTGVWDADNNRIHHAHKLTLLRSPPVKWTSTFDVLNFF